METVWRILGWPKEETSKCYYIHGFSKCSYFETAKCLANELQKQNPEIKIIVREVKNHEWPEHVTQMRKELGDKASKHRTSPFIYEGCTESNIKFIGGCDDFVYLVKKKYSFESPMCDRLHISVANNK